MIGNDAPEGKYATSDRVYEASSYAGYKFEITGYAVNKVSAAVRVKNIGIAPLYHNAYVTVKGVRSEKSLKGLLPGEEATYTVAGIKIDKSESPKLTITSDKLLKDATIPYKANLDGSETVIEGLLDENGTTAIARAHNLYSDKDNLGRFRASKLTDLKGRTPNSQRKGSRQVYYKVQKK